MNDNKQYLNDFKQELSDYKKKLSAIKDSFNGKTGKEVENIYNSLQSISQKAGEAYDKLQAASAEEWEPLKKIANNSLKELEKSFEEFKNSTSEHAKEYANQIEAYSQETIDLGAEYIKNNPFKSILLAGGLGFIVGRIIK